MPDIVKDGVIRRSKIIQLHWIWLLYRWLRNPDKRPPLLPPPPVEWPRHQPFYTWHGRPCLQSHCSVRVRPITTANSWQIRWNQPLPKTWSVYKTGSLFFEESQCEWHHGGPVTFRGKTTNDVVHQRTSEKSMAWFWRANKSEFHSQDAKLWTDRFLVYINHLNECRLCYTRLFAAVKVIHMFQKCTNKHI